MVQGYSLVPRRYSNKSTDVSEVQLWDWLKGLLPLGRYDRIESTDTALGFPDVDYCLSKGLSGNLELKDARFPQRRPPFKNEEDGLHGTQLHWMRENNKFGGVCWIVARVRPRIFWIHARHAFKFNGNPNLGRIATHVLDGNRIVAPDVKMINRMMRGEIR